MSKNYHNQPASAVQTNGTQVKKNEPRLFRGPCSVTNKILHMVPRKTIASELDVSESIIAKWVANEKPIPTERMYQIVGAGKAFCQEIQSLENEIDLMLMLNFGPNAK